MTAKRPFLSLFFFLVLLTYGVGPSRAETLVCADRPIGWDGIVANETWTAAGSPYVVRCSIGVDNLRVEPGVEVRVEGAFRITVLTTVTVAGTAAEPVTFTWGDGSTRWGGFLFQNTPEGSTFSHTVIKKTNQGAIHVLNGVSPVIEDCQFLNNTNGTHGGAINLQNASGEVTIRACRFKANTAAGHGGAMRVLLAAGSSLSVEDSVFEGNVANPDYALGNYVGGAIWIEAGNTRIVRTRFLNNRAYAKCYGGIWCNSCSVVGRGGAMYTNSNVDLNACHFYGNMAQSWNDGNCGGGSGAQDTQGGGIYVASGVLTATNCIFVENRTTGRVRSGASRGTFRGAAVYVVGGRADLINCTVARNRDTTALERGGGTLTVRNSIVFFNNNSGLQIRGTVNVTYSDVQGGWPGVGNTNVNPAFLGFGTELADLRLSVNSPCIDTGSDLVMFDDCTDPDSPAHGTAHNDMGAFGGPGACLLPPFDDCDGDFVDDAVVLAEFPDRDCDQDGRLDACELVDGTLTDEDDDGIADECQARSVWLDELEPLVFDVVLKSNVPFSGGELAIAYDPTVLAAPVIEPGADLPSTLDHLIVCPDPDPDPEDPQSCPNDPVTRCEAPNTGGASMLWINPNGQTDATPEGVYRMFRLTFAFREDAPTGRPSQVMFVSCLGPAESPVRNIITDGEGKSLPLLPFPEVVVPETFIRGDANDDGRIDVSDSVLILACLFTGSPPCPTCLDAADANDDGAMNLSDAVWLLAWRFLGGSPPPAPFPSCGRDLTLDPIAEACRYRSCP